MPIPFTPSLATFKICLITRSWYLENSSYWYGKIGEICCWAWLNTLYMAEWAVILSLHIWILFEKHRCKTKNNDLYFFQQMNNFNQKLYQLISSTLPTYLPNYKLIRCFLWLLLCNKHTYTKNFLVHQSKPPWCFGN